MGAGKARELLGLLDDTGLSLRKRDVPFALVLDELDGDLAPSWLLLFLVVVLLFIVLLLSPAPRWGSRGLVRRRLFRRPPAPLRSPIDAGYRRRFVLGLQLKQGWHASPLR